MAWRNVGSFYLAPGASARCRIWWDPPGDKGPQWIMAHAVKGQNPTELIVSDHAKKLDYSIGWVRSDGARGFVDDSYYYEYLVTVTNAGRQGVVFSLEGGGV